MVTQNKYPGKNSENEVPSTGGTVSLVEIEKVLYELLQETPLTLVMPPAGEVTGLQNPEGGFLLVAFDVATAAFYRKGDDLVIASQQEGTIIIAGYFSEKANMPLPPFILPDGTIAPVSRFLSAQTANLQ